MSKNLNLYPFSLVFNKTYNGAPFFASFPFIIDDNPVTEIACGISSIYAGDMKNDAGNKNRSVLFTELGLNPASVCGLKQIHSQTVLTVDSKNMPLSEADGLVTKDSGIVLSVTVADCLPVFLLDAKTGSFGIVHSGWKGTGIVTGALNQMNKNWGTKPSDVAAVLGPCIDSCCYKVDAQRASLFKEKFGSQSVREFMLYDAPQYFPWIASSPEAGKDYYLDLKAANIKLLEEAGVRNICVCEDCTFTDERLGSFRREGDEFTRMASLVGTIS